MRFFWCARQESCNVSIFKLNLEAYSTRCGTWRPVEVVDWSHRRWEFTWTIPGEEPRGNRTEWNLNDMINVYAPRANDTKVLKTCKYEMRHHPNKRSDIAERIKVWDFIAERTRVGNELPYPRRPNHRRRTNAHQLRGSEVWNNLKLPLVNLLRCQDCLLPWWRHSFGIEKHCKKLTTCAQININSGEALRILRLSTH